jgi:putative ABC transport system permease protein
VPVNLSLIRDKDEHYWNEYRGSPKAYISLEAGQRLWKNQFGNCTALRFQEAHITADSLERVLLRELDPRDFGMEVIPVHRMGKEAALNSVDFGSLFLYLSFFILAASVLLILLIHALNTEMRSHETGVLAGLGLSRKLIIRLRLAESAPVIVSGGLTGALAGIAYNYILMAGLNTIWQDALNFNMLAVQIRAETLMWGALTGILLAFFAIARISWRKLKNPVSGLLKQLPASGTDASASHCWTAGVLALLPCPWHWWLIPYLPEHISMPRCFSQPVGFFWQAMLPFWLIL